MCQLVANIDIRAGYRMGLSPTHNVTPTPQSLWVEKSPFRIAAKRLEIAENIKRARLITHVFSGSLVMP